MQNSSTSEQFETARETIIKRVVFSGGGAKGIVYGGAYNAMKETGMFNNVEELSGTSAGAINSALLAFGMQSSEFREKLLTTNLQELMGKQVKSSWKPNSQGISIVTKDGKPLEEFIRMNIIDAVRKNLKSLDSTNLESLRTQHQELDDVLNKIYGENPIITFNDLKILNQYFPKNFKKLNLPAVEFPNGKVQIFNSELTPDVEVALACRASASIPIILEPVTITIDGVPKKFVDGGLYDNLPTDYFDLDENQKFKKNTIPEQTLVFAFSEGIKNESNQVFQALYGQRWDESEPFDKVIREVVNLEELVNNISLSTGEKKQYIKKQQKNISIQIDKLVKSKKITKKEAKLFKKTINESINNLLLKPHKNRIFLKKLQSSNDSTEKATLIVEYIKKQLKPVLYNPGRLEKLGRNTLVTVLGDLNTTYANTDQKEIGYQKLRSEYPLRTVELRVGNIKTTSFNEANKIARILDSLGYLDTINHITNHNLHDPNVFNPGDFYIKMVTNFESIYHAILYDSAIEINNDKLIRSIKELREELEIKKFPPEKMARELYQLIKGEVEKDLQSPQAFALSRAVEKHNKFIDDKQIHEEISKQNFKYYLNFVALKRQLKAKFKPNTLHPSPQESNLSGNNQDLGTAQTIAEQTFEPLTKFSIYSHKPNLTEMINKYEKELQKFTKKQPFKKNNAQLYDCGQSLLQYIKKITKNKGDLISNDNLVELTNVLGLVTKTLQEIDDKNNTIQNVAELTKLSQTVHGKGSDWKKVGYALLSFSCAALVCIGVLAAIPSGGSSLLLAAIGATGLNLTVASSIALGTITTFAELGAILKILSDEHGLAKEVSNFQSALTTRNENSEKQEDEIEDEIEEEDEDNNPFKLQ